MFREKTKEKFGVVIIFISIFIGLVIFFFPNKSDEKKIEVDFSGINKICELATLKCYYHNVAKLENDSKGLFQYGWGKYGYKKFWMEYDGTVELAIDVNKVEINPADENGCVKVYVPPVEVKPPYLDKNSMGDPITDTGVFTEITLEDRKKALGDAQNDMFNEVSKDASIKNRAYENTKKLLYEYITDIGDLSGKKYTVEWIEQPMNKSKGDK